MALIPLWAFTINVFVQVIGVRYIKIGILKSLFLGYSVGIFWLGVMEFQLYLKEVRIFSDFLFIGIADVITFSALAYGYFHFVNLGVTARRIRLLIEIMDFNDGLTLEEILSRYNAKEMVENRLERLIGSGQIIEKDGSYFIGKPVMLVMSNMIVLMKLLVLGKKSEFD